MSTFRYLALVLAFFPAIAWGQARTSTPPTPQASPNVAGGIKVGPQLSIQSDGTLGLNVFNRPPGPNDDSAHGFSGGRITALQQISGAGSGYTTATCTLPAPTGTIGNIQATCTATISGGGVTGYVITNPGFGYSGFIKGTVSGDGSGAANPFAIVEPPTRWNYNGTIYTPVDLTPRSAVWAPLFIASPAGTNQVPLIVDAALAAGAPQPLWCLGTMQLWSGYAGSAALSLTTAAGSKTINLLNGDLDYITADDFVAGSTSNYVDTLYDQCGNGNNATGTSANGFQYYSNMVGNRHAITSVANQDTGSGPSNYMSFANTVSMTPLTSTLVTITRVRSDIKQTVALSMNGGNTVFQYANGSVAGIRAVNGITFGPATTNADIFIFSSSGSALKIKTTQFDINGSSFGSGVAYTDGVIGSTSAVGNSGSQDVVAELYFATTLTDAQLTAIMNAAIVATGMKPQSRCVIAGSGDSILFGYNSLRLRGWWNQLQQVGFPCRWYNNGVPAAQMSASVSNFSNYLAREYDPNAQAFIVVIEDGINSFNIGLLTAAQLETQVVSYAQTIRALGPNVKIIVQTIPQICNTTASGLGSCPQTANGSVATNTIAYNQWLRLNWRTFADALADVDGSPLFLNGAFNLNSSLTFDGVHPLELGASAYLPPYISAIRSVLPPN